jgi:hypothetical protein
LRYEGWHQGEKATGTRVTLGFLSFVLLSVGVVNPFAMSKPAGGRCVLSENGRNKSEKRTDSLREDPFNDSESALACWNRMQRLC